MISLRAATVQDAELLRRWERSPHVVAAKNSVLPTEEELAAQEAEWSWEVEAARDVPWREMMVAETSGRPVGYVAIIDPAEEESHYWGDCGPDLRAVDIWLGDPADLGRGYGTEIMRQVLARCFAPPHVTAVLIDPLVSNVRSIRFYQRLGFAHVGDRSFGDDQCAVYRLDRARWLSGS